MTSTAETTFDLFGTYVHLEDGPAASPVPVGKDFWEKINDRAELNRGRMVTLFRFRGPDDWAHWEMHPAGDEVVCLLSGALDLVLQDGVGERIVELRDRATSIIPRGAWHRGIVRAPSEALFITRGAGTQHRPV